MLTRRLFLLGSAISAVAAWFYSPLVSAKAKKLALPLSKAPKLSSVEGWAVLKIKGKEILFIRNSETSVTALSALCTHKNCQLSYDPKEKHIACACHRSSFNLEGKPLGGPAKKPLANYHAKLSGERILFELEE